MNTDDAIRNVITFVKILLNVLSYTFLTLLMLCLFFHSFNSKAGRLNRFSSFVFATGIFTYLASKSHRPRSRKLVRLRRY